MGLRRLGGAVTVLDSAIPATITLGWQDCFSQPGLCRISVAPRPLRQSRRCSTIGGDGVDTVTPSGSDPRAVIPSAARDLYLMGSCGD